MGGQDQPALRGRSTELVQGNAAAAPDGGKLREEADKLLNNPSPRGQVENILKANGIFVQPKEETIGGRSRLDEIANSSLLARLGLLTVEGTAYSLPGVANAALYDVSHPVETLEKGTTAFAFGVGMRTLLPKSGAGRAIAAVGFTYLMAKDALVPIGRGIGEVWDAQDHRTVNQAAQRMGDGLGTFGWDAYWGMKIAGAGEDFAEPMMKGLAGDRRYARWEKGKADFLGSDEYFFGRQLNRFTRTVDHTTDKLSAHLKGVKVKAEPELSFAEKVARTKEAGERHLGVVANGSMHKHGFVTTDGQAIGLSETMNILQMGKDPRLMTAAQVAELHGYDGYKFVESASGLHISERPSLIVVEGGKVRPLETPGAKPVETAGAKPGDTAAKPSDAASGTKPAGLTIGQDVNVANITKLAAMAKAEMNKLTPEQQQVIDAVEGSVGPIHAALNPNHKALDPGYREWGNQVIALGREIGGNVDNLKQVAPLLFRGRDAAIGQMTAGLGPTGRNVHSLNLMSWEMYWLLIEGMKRNGLNPKELMAANNPPLNLIAYDHGAGPHTLPEINKVWDVDLVHWPRNMQDLQILRAGIKGHEDMHDQYGGILRFADSIREQVIGETVRKAIGDKAHEKVNVPGHGEMTKQDLYVAILKAQANENTADMGGAAHTGPNGATALGVLLQGLREHGRLEVRNVYGKELVTPENPLGFEVHAIDAFRPKLVAEMIRQRANGDPTLLEAANALDKYAEEASRGGDFYVWVNMDSPGQVLKLPKKEVDALIPHLVSAQLNTPLPAFNGKTYADVLPDLPTQVRKMTEISKLMEDWIVNNKPLEELPFSTRDYTMIQLQSAGMPTALRLVAKGMPAEEVNAAVNRVSNHLELQFHMKGDPHVGSLVPRVTMADFIANPALAIKETRKGMGRFLEKQPQMRDWSDRNLSVFSGYNGMHFGRKWFQDYKPGSAADALVNGPVPPPEPKGVPDNPAVHILFSPGSSGPAGEPRDLPRHNEPFLSGGSRRPGSLDLKEFREVQEKMRELEKNEKK
ncbi:MAG: hypothetical protein K2X93_17975 [Candidatus Obscuribacterales bacterium]|nr:hypothetical protein [Candidatus Obscuribacterales bacterium]